MIRTAARALAAGLILAAPAAAADMDAPRHAVGADLFFSTDAEDTEVVRAGLNFDLRRSGPEKYLGLRVEKAWFRPLGEHWRGRERGYVRAADEVGGWKWNATVGSDGHTILGSAAIHDEERFRKELFVERDIIETPRGLDRGIYYTFGGLALDLPADERNVVTLVGGLQEFTGDNLRTHARANFVHVLKPEAGVSLQLRTRWFRNSHPREQDYYSPRWYAQAVPVLQLRRFTDSGWRYLVAGGVGLQRDSDSDWRRSSYFNAQVSSPQRARWAMNGALLFSETPSTAGSGYRYLQLSFGLTRAF